MTGRPLFRSTIDQLESLFREDQGIESLKKLKDELQFRSTPRATILLRKVDTEIEAFAAKAQPLNLNRTLEGKNNPTDFPDSVPVHTTPATENVQSPSTDARTQN